MPAGFLGFYSRLPFLSDEAFQTHPCLPCFSLLREGRKSKAERLADTAAWVAKKYGTPQEAER